MNEMTVLAVVLAVGLFLIVVGAVLGRRAQWTPERWAADLGLQVTPVNEGLIRSYIARTRGLRTLGAVAGFATPIVYSQIADRSLPAPFDFSLLDAAAGYLIGAVLAELTVRRPKSDAPAASLTPRALKDYLPPVLTTALRVSALIALGLAAVLYLLPEDQVKHPPDLPPAIPLIVSVVVIVAGVEALQRFIVRRPQPVVHPDLLRADDAIRSASLHALAGAGLALEFMLLSGFVFAIGLMVDVQIMRWTLPWLSIALWGVGLGCWMHTTRPQTGEAWRLREGIQA